LEVTDTPTTAPTNTPRPSPTTAPTNTPAEPTEAEEDEMGTMTDATEEVTGETDDEEAFTPGGTGLVPPDVVTNTPPPTSTPLPTPEGAAPSSETDEDGTTAEEAEGVAVGDPCVYVVQAGDNAFRIAVNNNVTLDELVEANPSLSGSNPVIQPGQELVIPGCESDGTEDEEPAEATGEAPTPPPSGFETYTVTSGDTLVAIARRYGTTVDAIVDANDLTNPNRLSIGQELLIPIEAGN
jgi:LysM repeat protein